MRDFNSSNEIIRQELGTLLLIMNSLQYVEQVYKGNNYSKSKLGGSNTCAVLGTRSSGMLERSSAKSWTPALQRVLLSLELLAPTGSCSKIKSFSNIWE